MMTGTLASVRTLLMIVGLPKRPLWAGSDGADEAALTFKAFQQRCLLAAHMSVGIFADFQIEAEFVEPATLSLAHRRAGPRQWRLSSPRIALSFLAGFFAKNLARAPLTNLYRHKALCGDGNGNPICRQSVRCVHRRGRLRPRDGPGTRL
jgi:hypothetical protein